MHSFPTHAPRQRYARKAPTGGKGGAAWGKPCPRRHTLPPPSWRTSEHKAQHHPHEQYSPSDDGRHDRNIGRPRPRQPGANADRTIARHPGGRRHGRHPRTHTESSRRTKDCARPKKKNSTVTHRGLTKNNGKVHRKMKKAPPRLPSPASGSERSPLPAGGGYAEGTPNRRERKTERPTSKKPHTKKQPTWR